MARPKKSEGDMTTRSFRLTVELDAALKDVAAASRQGVTDILVGLVEELVAANRAGIADYRRRQKLFSFKATFAEPTPPKKSARPSKKKKPAQVADNVKGGENVAENS